MAGAIVRHFNNQLGVVLGNLELDLCDLSRDWGPIKNPVLENQFFFN
jgi:hypothetical protein